MTLNDAFEQLRTLAEADTANKGTDKRRPSWGPALTVEVELDSLLASLGYWKPDDKKVLRLWARFADPTKVGTMLRTQVSQLPMLEARCRAFELRVGVNHSGPYLLRTQRGRDGQWWVGHASRPTFSGGYEWQRLREELARARQWHRACAFESAERQKYGDEPDPVLEDRLQHHQQCVAKLELRDAELRTAHAAHNQRYERLHELARQRVSAFAGNPYPQMIAGARVTGNCAICGRQLTDPTSVERGIGPECYGHIAPALRSYVERRAAA
jgi:Family of unknown function (DUF6011)